jgi:uncharacterized protein YyaL (SSP411 family)
MQTPPEGRNRLAFETSPYLLQHADNPVDWYPWGDEAFERATREDKPIIVSIGYSSCHWCHVMEHECFEDPEIAAIMNEHFVCVKVDREERPDVDEIYMTAVQMMGVGGGWPLNVFVTPDGVPFFGGTYFPPKTYANRMGWPDLMQRISAAWKEDRSRILEQSSKLVEALRSSSRYAAADDLPEPDLLARTARNLGANFDEKYGGFGGAPKFPPHLALRFLLRHHVRTGDERPLEIVEHTLRRMAAGGIYDQLGGGFHRYSTDERWLVPHFEKMLYDNAQLARAYVEAFQVTGDPEYERVVRETLDYVLREMTEESGGFRSATDADSEGREGVFFVWTEPEIDELLGDGAALFKRAYGIDRAGNFTDVHHPTPPGEPGMNVLHLPTSLEDLARAEGRARDELEDLLAEQRDRLLERRKSRIRPGLDDKVLASWNGLMIAAFAYAGRVLDEPRYLDAAVRAADFVLRELRDGEGRLLRTHRAGESRIRAFLKDHAFLIDACLDLYEATFDLRWLNEARSLADDMNRLFSDEEEGGWYHTAIDAEELLTRSMTPHDGAIPSGNGAATQVMLRLAVLTGEEGYRERADAALRRFAGAMERASRATLGLLIALDERLHEDGEIAIVGPPGEESTRTLLRKIHSEYLPGVALALLDPEGNGAEVESRVPLLHGKTLVDGGPAVYVCRSYACRAPVTSVAGVERALSEHRGRPR